MSNTEEELRKMGLDHYAGNTQSKSMLFLVPYVRYPFIILVKYVRPMQHVVILCNTNLICYISSTH